VLNVMEQGSFFGEIGLLFSVPRTASCRCNGRCVILVLTKDKFSQAMATSPEAARTISMIAKERFSSYVKQQQDGDVVVDFGDEMEMGITNEDLKNVCHF
jgi:CRP-like cAMP-binding protein